VSDICFSKDGTLLASVGMDSKLKIWNFPDCNLSESVDTGGSDFTYCSFNPGNTFISVNSKSKVALYSVKNSHLIKTFTVIDINSADFCLKSKKIAIQTSLGKIHIYDIDTRNETESIDTDLNSKNRSFSISSGNKFIVTGNDNREIILYSTPFDNFNENEDEIISENGKYLVVFSANKAYKIWELPVGEVIKNIQLDFNFTTVAVSGDGKYIALGVSDKIYIVRDSIDDKITLDNESGVTSIIFSPDGKFMATAGDKGTIKIWEVPSFKHLTCLFDKSILARNIKVNQYTSRNESGETITFTLPCGSPIPAGAICVCNCVPGSACSCVGHSTCSCVGHSNCGCVGNSGTYCQCDQICTCVPIK
jgi:WD40 repeat protein